MDKTSKRFLKYLQNCPNYTQAYLGTAEQLKEFGTPTEIDKMVRYLESQGYVSTIKGIDDKEIGVTLEHKGIHWKEFQREEELNYFKEKWIMFMSLIVSVIALILSIVK